MTLRMDLTSTDSGESTNLEPYLEKIQPATDILSVPEKAEVNSTAATSLLRHEPLERGSTAYSKGDNSASCTDKGTADVDCFNVVNSAQFDCRIGSGGTVQECNVSEDLTHNKNGCHVSEFSIKNSETAIDEISSLKSAVLEDAVTQNQSDLETENRKNDNTSKVGSGIDGNNIVNLDNGGSSDEIKDKSKDISASVINRENISNKNSVLSEMTEQKPMVGKLGISENVVSSICNGTFESDDAVVTTNEKLSSDIEARKEIQTEHKADVSHDFQTQVISSGIDKEESYSQFQNTNSESTVCEENEKLIVGSDNTNTEGSQQEKDKFAQEEEKMESEKCEKTIINTEKEEIESVTITKESSDITNEVKQKQDNKYFSEEESNLKNSRKENLIDKYTTEMTESQKEEKKDDFEEKSDKSIERCQSSGAKRKDENDENSLGKTEGEDKSSLGETRGEDKKSLDETTGEGMNNLSKTEGEDKSSSDETEGDDKSSLGDVKGTNNLREDEKINSIKDRSNNAETTANSKSEDLDNVQDSNIGTSVKLLKDSSHIYETDTFPKKDSCQSNSENKLVGEIKKEEKEELVIPMDVEKVENCEIMKSDEPDGVKTDKTLNLGLENNIDELKKKAATGLGNLDDEIKSDDLSSDIWKQKSENLLAENSAVSSLKSIEESKIENKNKGDNGTNIKEEIKIKKKRGRKPNAVTKSNLSAVEVDQSDMSAVDLDQSDWKEVVSPKRNNKGKMENVGAGDLNGLSIDCANNQLKSAVHSISPTRSGRKSYKKLNEEFLYDYESSERDIEFSPHKKISDSNSPKNMSLELENSDSNLDDLDAKNSSSRKLENLKHSNPSNFKNTKCHSENLRRTCAPKGSSILYKCKDCDFESALRPNFKEHASIHLGYKYIYCNNCDFKTCHKNNIFSHCENVHGDRNGYKVILDLKQEQFLSDYIKDCHQFVPRKYLSYVKNLKKRLSATKIKTSSYKTFNYYSVYNNVVKCPYCKFQSYSNSNIEKHILWKHKMNTYQCPLCEFSSFLRTEVSLHISNKHGRGTCSPIKSLKSRTEETEEEGEGLKNLEGSSGPKNLDTSLGPYWNQTSSARKRLFKSGTVKRENILRKSSMKGKFSQFSGKTKMPEKCPVCSFESIAVVGIRRHMFFRHKLCAWVCTGCSATFTQRDEAVSHTEMYHRGQKVKISRTLPLAPSRVTNPTSKEMLLSLDTEVKIARKMKKQSNLYTCHLKRRKSSLHQNDGGKLCLISDLKTESQNSILNKDLKEKLGFENMESNFVENIERSEVEQIDFKSDIPALSEIAPSGGDISHQSTLTIPRKPGRPKINKTVLNNKNSIELQMTGNLKQQKKRGRKRKGESQIDDNVSGRPVKKFRKSLESSNLNLSKESPFDCVQDISAENCNIATDGLVLNVPSTCTPVNGKKRGPKKKADSSSLSQSEDIVHIIGEDESKVKTTVMKQEEKTVLDSLCGSINGVNTSSAPKTPKSKIIMTVADVHQSDVNSDSEFTNIYSKIKKECAVPGIESFYEKQNKKAELKQTCGLNEENIDELSDGGLKLDLERKYKQKQKKLKNIKTSDIDSGSDSCLQSESEKLGEEEESNNGNMVKKKRGRKKKIDNTKEVDENEVWSNWKSSSYVLHPKKIDKVQVAYSCPYCNYAAPLRHQLRLHCYGRHTDRPACLIEFKIKRKPGRPPRKSSNVNQSPKQPSKSKSSSPCKETNQNVQDRIVLEGEVMCPSVLPKTTIKKRFNNPLKPMVRQLNGCRVCVYDTFHSCVDIDDVDRYLDKFGVRTLNMDMLTPKQFSKFMSKFGGNLQGVDL